MSNNFRFSYADKDKEKFALELNKSGMYYGNVVMWTVFFTLPLFWLLDYLIDPFEWIELMLIRLIVTCVSYLIYVIGVKRRWNYLYTICWFVSINVLMHSVICGIVPINQLMPYFLMISVVLLLINTALFWPPVYSILICILSYMVIIWLFSYKDRIDRFSVLISHGGGVYFIVSSFSCLIAYNRYQIVKKEIEKNSIIDAANNRLLIQNEKINDQKYVIEEANRKLKVLNDYRHNTLNIMLNDFRNFTGSIQMSLDLLKKSADNLTSEQNEILNYIGTGNEKLNYLSEKLADSAEKEEAQVDFSYETFDINPFIERVVMDIADTAGIKQINLQLHLSPSSILVYLDKLFLGQVLFKLLMNALRYAEKGSVLTIHTHQLNNKCVIEVVNIGGLIGKEKLTELFNKLNPYLTLRESILTGADMGFSVARKLTETMGGSFTFSSEENTGNYYRIEFNYTH